MGAELQHIYCFCRRAWRALDPVGQGQLEQGLEAAKQLQRTILDVGGLLLGRKAVKDNPACHIINLVLEELHNKVLTRSTSWSGVGRCRAAVHVASRGLARRPCIHLRLLPERQLLRKTRTVGAEMAKSKATGAAAPLVGCECMMVSRS